MTGSKTWLAQPNRLRDFVIIVLFLLVIGLGWIQLDNFWNSPLTIPISSLRSMPVNSTQGMLEFLVRSQRAMVSQLQQTLNTTDILLERIEHLEKTTSTFKHELELQRNVTFGLEHKLQWMDQVSQLFSKHLRNPHFYPVKDVIQVDPKSGNYAFMSEVEGRGKQSGPPEFFYFPSNVSQNRLLCVKGNHTSDGTKNLYGYAYEGALPADVVLLPGITLIADTLWDFVNPWHSMYNLIQFLYWKVDHSCASANQLLLYHWGELRETMGYWISNVYRAIALPFVPESLSYDGRPVCFEQAVVSRIGIGGVPSEILQNLFAEMRCEIRRYCNFTAWKNNSSGAEGMQVTLMVRTGARSFVDLSAWETVVKMECEKVPGCR
ncbi:hypothetical protein O6H91_15G019100 [Diphasiastrum complanatum]|nr:hypothetical protein O6H91_15G019100 [Diphasiastrum complanatum]